MRYTVQEHDTWASIIAKVTDGNHLDDIPKLQFQNKAAVKNQYRARYPFFMRPFLKTPLQPLAGMVLDIPDAIVSHTYRRKLQAPHRINTPLIDAITAQAAYLEKDDHDIATKVAVLETLAFNPQDTKGSEKIAGAAHDKVSKPCDCVIGHPAAKAFGDELANVLDVELEGREANMATAFGKRLGLPVVSPVPGDQDPAPEWQDDDKIPSLPGQVFRSGAVTFTNRMDQMVWEILEHGGHLETRVNVHTQRNRFHVVYRDFTRNIIRHGYGMVYLDALHDLHFKLTN